MPACSARLPRATWGGSHPRDPEVGAEPLLQPQGRCRSCLGSNAVPRGYASRGAAAGEDSPLPHQSLRAGMGFAASIARSRCFDHGRRRRERPDHRHPPHVVPPRHGATGEVPPWLGPQRRCLITRHTLDPNAPGPWRRLRDRELRFPCGSLPGGRHGVGGQAGWRHGAQPDRTACRHLAEHAPTARPSRTEP